MKPNIIVLGSNGQLGSEFVKKEKTSKLDAKWIFLDRKDIDLNKLNIKYFNSIIDKYKPSIVINCAAYTNVEKAETEPEKAFKINGESIGEIIKILSIKSIPFVHFSTDYVFGDSSNKLLKPNDIKKPISIYGKSKLKGEQLILENIGKGFKKFLIIRVSWVFGKNGKNFVKTILKLAKDRDILNVVNDQFGGPTSSDSIADFIIHLVPFMISNKSPKNYLKNSFPWGIYHFQGKPIVSWSDFATTIFNYSRDKKIISKEIKINLVSTSAFQSKAKRQLNSRLDCSLTKDLFNKEMPDWRKDLDNLLNDLFEIK